MNAGCSASYYADHLQCVDTAIEQVRLLAQGTYAIRVAAPQIAAAVVPGQFVMLRLSGRDSPLIGRALAVYDVIDDTTGAPRAIDLVFVRKGALTTPLAEAPLGTRVTLWGPLGNGFSSTPCDLLVMAAGGVGQTPMLLVAKEATGARSFVQPPRADESTADGPASNGPAAVRPSGWAKSVRLVYGARTADLLAGVDDFRGSGIDVQLCTDDGSAGAKRRVPQHLQEQLDEELRSRSPQSIRVVCCGPEIMMQKVAEVCAARRIPCDVSLETPMACGIGICFSCVAMVRPAGSSPLEQQPWDYKRTCVEGPVFDARRIVW